MLAAGAMVASLLAIGAAPAAAVDQDSEQDHKATKEVCAGEAANDRGFTDLGTLDAAVRHINCLAHYGITAGKTADTFDPNTNVTRGQMALFLRAAANLMGVDLSGVDITADFGDISDLGDNRQAAIAVLSSNGIMAGRGANFEPHADITRAEMAVALVNLLYRTPGAPVHTNSQGLFILGEDARTAKLPNDSFADAEASESQPVNNAISAAYELGITSGVGDGTMFNPSGSVPRRNMATFIINTLNHSNVNPPT